MNPTVTLEYEKDLEEFYDFQELWRAGTLSKNHPVIGRVRDWSRKIASDYKDLSRADDLEQDCLIALESSGYNGRAALDTFIVKILLSKNIAAWRKRGGKRQVEMPEQMTDEASHGLLQDVLERLSSDILIKRLLEKKSDVKAAIILTITEAEHTIGRKRIAELATERLGEKVTRHQVEVVLAQLRDIFSGDDFGYA